jgi:putative ABC transport system permease protein
VRRVAPLIAGNSEINANGRLREVVVAGTASTYFDIRSFKLAQGHFLPEGDWNRSAPVVVIGAKIKEEIFGANPAVGELIRLGDRRLRIVGVLKSVGQGLGMNTDEVVFVPVSVAQSLFNTNSLFRILIEARSRDEIEAVKREAMAALKARHGEEDITVITQDAVLATFDKLLRALTAAVAGIAAISLAVAGILVMNVMLVAVTQRTGEIGLLKALGARAATIRNAFMAEAAMLSLVGAITGYGLGLFGAFVLRQLYPVFPAYPPDWAVIAALGTALGTGLLFGIMPARRAARLDPVQALMKH